MDPKVAELHQDIKRAAYDAKVREMGGADCVGCGAPAGYPPAGPCDDHGTPEAVASDNKQNGGSDA